MRTDRQQEASRQADVEKEKKKAEDVTRLEGFSHVKSKNTSAKKPSFDKRDKYLVHIQYKLSV